MKRRTFINQLGTGTIISGLSIPLLAAASSKQPVLSINSDAIQHMVIFVLKHDKGSVAETKFLADARTILTKIPVVKDFRVLDQVSIKTITILDFQWYLPTRQRMILTATIPIM